MQLLSDYEAILVAHIKGGSAPAAEGNKTKDVWKAVFLFAKQAILAANFSTEVWKKQSRCGP